jgi:hypothetical protein
MGPNDWNTSSVIEYVRGFERLEGIKGYVREYVKRDSNDEIE